MQKRLERSIGYLTGTSYCVTIVIGAGILGLPGVAAKAAGTNSIYAWLIDFLLVIPLLIVFSKLITLVQSAGGVSDFVKAAFGEGLLYRFSQMLLIVTLIVGTAAISLVGAQYLGGPIGWSKPTIGGVAILLVLIPTIINSFGIRVGGTLQNCVAASLIAFLLVVISSSFGHWRLADIVAFNPYEIHGMWTAMGLIWFAFTGIEMISFLGEDFKSPRTFIFSVITSFFVVGFLYLGLAIAVKEVVPSTDPLLVTSPLIAVINRTLGGMVGKLGGAFGFLLILINLSGAILGASRLIYAVGRDGLFLPKRISELNSRGVPSLSLWLLSITSIVAIAVIYILNLSLEPIFLIVSQHWFILYLLAILAFLKLRTTHWHTVLGLLSLVLAVAFMRAFSWYLVIPLAILLAAMGVRKKSPEVPHVVV